jgi:gentisate 1,2-dioxygenase
MVDTLQPSTQKGLAALHERMASWSLAGHWQPRRELAPLDASFFELSPASSQPITKPDGISRWGLGLTRPRQAAASNEAPPFNYQWQDTQAALEALAGGEGDPFDGVLLEYTNPLTGGHTMPTINCQIQMLRPGEATGVHRHTSSSIYHCVRGSGVTTVDELGLEWGEKDCFFVPSWRWHSHRNASNTLPAILFSVSDRPVLEALGLYRVEEPHSVSLRLKDSPVG